MKQEQDRYYVTARVLTGMWNVLKEVKPDVVLVHSDTTTSTGAAFFHQGYTETNHQTRFSFI